MANPLHDRLFAAQAHSDAPFLWLPDGRILSHAAFFELTGRFAAALAQRGVTAGDCVAAQTRKSAEALALYAACVRLGAIYLPLNTAYTPTEIAWFVSDAEPRLLVADEAAAAALAPAASVAGAAIDTLNGDGSGSLAALAAKAPPRTAAVERAGSDLAAILYTSGTTGRSKGAMLTHDNLLSNALTLAAAWRFTAADRLLHALPIYHTHGLFVATNTILAAGAAMIFLPAFEIGEMFRHLPHATTMMGVPTFYTRLLADPRLTRESTRHMRLFISGSAPLLAETHRDFAGRTGHAVLERYGMTETNMNTSNPLDGERRAGTVGPALPGVGVRIADPQTGELLPDGSTGMIEVKGPNVFSGYWRMPDRTREEFRADGWFITGDLGFLDDQKYITIVGRAKDVIIAGGFNIYPKEIELLLDSLPGVIESAVFGVSHPDLGEAVVALLAVAPDHPRDESAILAAIAPTLARFKQPRRILFADDLPRNPMGKVQKAELRRLHAGILQESS